MNVIHPYANANFTFVADVCDEDQFECLDSMGYPMPSISMANGESVLVN